MKGVSCFDQFMKRNGNTNECKLFKPNTFMSTSLHQNFNQQQIPIVINENIQM